MNRLISADFWGIKSYCSLCKLGKSDGKERHCKQKQSKTHSHHKRLLTFTLHTNDRLHANTALHLTPANNSVSGK